MDELKADLQGCKTTCKEDSGTRQERRTCFQGCTADIKAALSEARDCAQECKTTCSDSCKPVTPFGDAFRTCRNDCRDTSGGRECFKACNEARKTAQGEMKECVTECAAAL